MNSDRITAVCTDIVEHYEAKVTPLGMGQGSSPVIEKGPMPPSYLQVVVFTPQ